MLKELKFVMGAVAKKDFLPALTHFRIENGRVRGFNGKLALCSPIPFDINCTPKADALIKAIQHCDDTVVLTMTPAGRLSVRSGKFKAFIDCVDAETPHVEPTGAEFQFDGEALLKAVKTISPFISDDASRPWSNGVLLRGQSAYATNNVTLVEYWIGSEFPFECCIPSDAVKELLRINEAPTHGQFDNHSLTLHFSDGRWVRTQLLSTEWPDLARIFNVPSNPVPIEDAIFAALAKVKPFADKIGRVYFRDGALHTHTGENEGATVELPGLQITGSYQIEKLSLLEGVAQKVDWSLYPKPAMFFGERVRGAIVGMRMTEATDGT